jgi:MarR family transcriptional regulator for hemolysin
VTKFTVADTHSIIGMNTPTPAPSRTSLGFLIGDVSRLLRRDFDRRLAHVGLSQAQWRVLARLSVCEGINQASLAEQIEIQPITLTRLIDRMGASGWVERRPDPKDRRAVRLCLTAKAQPLLSELHRLAEETRMAAPGSFEEAETRRLMENLAAIKTNLLNAAERPSAAKASGPHGLRSPRRSIGEHPGAE